jgi:hypothetical protein
MFDEREGRRGLLPPADRVNSSVAPRQQFGRTRMVMRPFRDQAFRLTHTFSYPPEDFEH